MLVNRPHVRRSSERGGCLTDLQFTSLIRARKADSISYVSNDIEQRKPVEFLFETQRGSWPGGWPLALPAGSGNAIAGCAHGLKFL